MIVQEHRQNRQKISHLSSIPNLTSIFTRDEPNTEADSRTNDVATDHENSRNTTLLDDITVTPDHVATVLRALDNDKAQRPALCDLFNKSLRTGVVPRDWKLANVVHVFKKGEKEHVENYRPISLLSLISKVLECCLFDCIKDHVFSQINPCQHGFIPGRN